jgi:hypothetical protein
VPKGYGRTSTQHGAEVDPVEPLAPVVPVEPVGPVVPVEPVVPLEVVPVGPAEPAVDPLGPLLTVTVPSDAVVVVTDVAHVGVAAGAPAACACTSPDAGNRLTPQQQIKVASATIDGRRATGAKAISRHSNEVTSAPHIFFTQRSTHAFRIFTPASRVFDVLSSPAGATCSASRPYNINPTDGPNNPAAARKLWRVATAHQARVLGSRRGHRRRPERLCQDCLSQIFEQGGNTI